MVFKYMDSRLKISGMTKKEASFLNGSTRGLNNGREHFYGSKKKKQKRGFPPEFQAWQKGKPFQRAVKPNYEEAKHSS